MHTATEARFHIDFIVSAALLIAAVQTAQCRAETTGAFYCIATPRRGRAHVARKNATPSVRSGLPRDLIAPISLSRARRSTHLRSRLDDADALEIRFDVTVLWCQCLARELSRELATNPLKEVPGFTGADLRALGLLRFASASCLSVLWVVAGLVTRQFEPADSYGEGLRRVLLTSAVTGPLWLLVESALHAGLVRHVPRALLVVALRPRGDDGPRADRAMISGTSSKSVVLESLIQNMRSLDSGVLRPLTAAHVPARRSVRRSLPVRSCNARLQARRRATPGGVRSVPRAAPEPPTHPSTSLSTTRTGGSCPRSTRTSACRSVPPRPMWIEAGHAS